MKQVPHCGPTNVWHHSTKFSHHGELGTRICASLVSRNKEPSTTRVSSIVTVWLAVSNRNASKFGKVLRQNLPPHLSISDIK